MSAQALAAAVLAAGAAAAAVQGGIGVVGRAAGRRPGRRPLLTAFLVAVVVALPLWMHGRRLVLGLVLLGAGLAVARLVSRGRRARTAQQRADRVLSACAGLAADLRAGEPPVRALDRAAEDWPELAAVARAAHLGADVPAALRLVAGRPGAEQLVAVAAAWEVAHRSGAELAPSVSRVAQGIAEARTVRRLLAAELASAHATARLMAVLPFVLLLIGRGLGGDPVHFLLDTGPGLGCLAVGLLLSFAGLSWLDRIAEGVLR